jgi:hypothetical protein
MEIIVITSRGLSERLGPARWNVQPAWEQTSPSSKGSSTYRLPLRANASWIDASLSSPMRKPRPRSSRWLPAAKASGPISSGVACSGIQAVHVAALASGQ